MAKLKSLLLGKLKDKASQGKATVLHVFRPTAKSLQLALLKSTTHNSKKQPDDDYVAAVLSYSHSRRHAPAAVAAALWRLRATRDACVAAKCLIILHKLIKPRDGFSGEVYIKDHRLFHSKGRNILKLNSFQDNSSHLTLELSPWIRWYARYLDCISSTSRDLGYFPDMTANSKDKAQEKQRLSHYETGYVMEQTESLVSLFEHIYQMPQNPPLYQNKIVDEIRELVAQDYFSVMRLVMVRLEVLSKRLVKPDELGPVLARLEESKKSLTGFSWRCKVLVEDFWCMVKELKNKIVLSYKDVGIYTGKWGGSGEPVWVTFDDPVQFNS